MNLMEIVLLIVGAVVFVLSFILPEKKNAMRPETEELVKDEVKKQIEREMAGAKERIDDIVDETVTYAVEKTERSLERLSNEKIMAVNEYSDTVLNEIHKNHEEVVFLYDMLNNKQNHIKKTVSEVEKTVKDMEQSVKDVENNVKDMENSVKDAEKDMAGKTEAVTEEVVFEALPVKKVAAKPTAKRSGRKTAQKPEEVTGNVIGRAPGEEVKEVDLSFIEGPKSKGRNNNELILSLHKAGKSNVAIAKELGLGIGEVKLVIDLFEGM